MKRSAPVFPKRRRGMILLVVTVVIAMLSLGALTFVRLMMAEREAVEMSVRQAQGRAAAESGIEMAKAFITLDQQSQTEAGGWYDNPQYFRGVVVADSGPTRGRSRFTLVAPVMGEGGAAGIRFGLEDESAKLNLNALALADKAVPGAASMALMNLPGMTEDVADAILDWIDADEEPREYGAELETYGALDPPYAPRNGPLGSIEELLLVRGVTPGLLFGVDANRNGLVEPAELAGEALLGIDNSDGSMSRGWAAYLTLYSLEANVQSNGKPRIDVNQSDLKNLYKEVAEAVDEQWATFIVAYRQNGRPAPTSGSPSTNGGGTSTSQKVVTSGEIDFEQPAKVSLKTILDLIGPDIQVKFKGENQASMLVSPFPADPLQIGSYLTNMMEYLTAAKATVIPARINVNLAPRVVLLGIPGMTPEIVEQILTQRQSDPAQQDGSQRYETWLLSQGIVTLEQMKQMIPFVTGGGNVFRVQAVGYFDEAGPFARIEAVLDASAGGKPPRVVFWRDMSHLGRGYALETLGVDLPEQ